MSVAITLHEDEPWGFTMNAEYGWELSPGLFFTTAGGFGAASPASDENQFSGTNFYNLLVGFDLTMGQDNLVSPHLGLNFGVIGEHGSITGATYNFQGGLQLKTSREKRNYVRLSIQLGKHGADDDTGEALRGPITNTIGYVHTF